MIKSMASRSLKRFRQQENYYENNKINKVKFEFLDTRLINIARL